MKKRWKKAYRRNSTGQDAVHKILSVLLNFAAEIVMSGLNKATGRREKMLVKRDTVFEELKDFIKPMTQGSIKMKFLDNKATTPMGRPLSSTSGNGSKARLRSHAVLLTVMCCVQMTSGTYLGNKYPVRLCEPGLYDWNCKDLQSGGAEYGIKQLPMETQVDAECVPVPQYKVIVDNSKTATNGGQAWVVLNEMSKETQLNAKALNCTARNGSLCFCTPSVGCDGTVDACQHFKCNQESLCHCEIVNSASSIRLLASAGNKVEFWCSE